MKKRSSLVFEDPSALHTTTSLDEAIEDLFDFADYPHIQQGMWEWIKATICGDFNTRMDAKEKDFLIIMFEKIQALIKAANNAHQKNHIE